MGGREEGGRGGGVKWEGGEEEGREGRREGEKGVGGGRVVSGDRTMKRIRSSSTKRV